MSKVALIKGTDRYKNILKALDCIANDLQLTYAKNIVIKVNLTSPVTPSAITHIDAIRAVLDFLCAKNVNQITIAEGTGSGMMSTINAYHFLNYYSLFKKYNVRFVDLNSDDSKEEQVLNCQIKPMCVRVANTILNSDYRISLCLPKTHNSVILSASIKNMVMGSLIRSNRQVLFPALRKFCRSIVRKLPIDYKNRISSFAAIAENNDKLKMHQGSQAMNLNISTLSKLLMPNLAIIDGFEAMEGNGPINGDKVSWGIALASTDAVACDSVVAKLMGIDPNQIGYLKYCIDNSLRNEDIDNINIIGNSIDECKRIFKLHENYNEQLNWRIENL